MKTGDRLITAITADGIETPLRISQASKTGERFISMQTASGIPVAMKIRPVTKAGERGFPALTADGVPVLVTTAQNLIYTFSNHSNNQYVNVAYPDLSDYNSANAGTYLSRECGPPYAYELNGNMYVMQQDSFDVWTPASVFTGTEAAAVFAKSVALTTTTSGDAPGAIAQYGGKIVYCVRWRNAGSAGGGYRVVDPDTEVEEDTGLTGLSCECIGVDTSRGYAYIFNFDYDVNGESVAYNNSRITVVEISSGTIKAHIPLDTYDYGWPSDSIITEFPHYMEYCESSDTMFVTMTKTWTAEEYIKAIDCSDYSENDISLTPGHVDDSLIIPTNSDLQAITQYPQNNELLCVTVYYIFDGTWQKQFGVTGFDLYDGSQNTIYPLNYILSSVEHNLSYGYTNINSAFYSGGILYIGCTNNTLRGFEFDSDNNKWLSGADDYFQVGSGTERFNYIFGN